MGRANSSILHTPEDVKAGKPRQILDSALSEGKSNGHELVAISISDTGTGIKPEEQARLFQAFGRLENAGCAEGTGLGLYLTRKLTALLGGKIELESEYGKGSTFRLLIQTTPNEKDE